MEQVAIYKGVKILALAPYFSKTKDSENHSTDAHSKTLIKFKNGDSDAISHMEKRLTDILLASTLKDRDFYIATIPSSTKGKAHSGFKDLIINLSKKFKILNPTANVLKRIESKTPAHLGGSRKKADILSTLSISAEMTLSIKGKPILLLDDITTTTNSLQAGIDLLSEKQAKVIVAIALGKTV